MLALNHALFSGNIALIASIYFDQPLFLPVIILVIFAGIIPDVDHPNSELGKILPPISRALPHRGITHSLLGFTLFYFLIQFVFLNYNQYLTYFLLFGCLFGVFLLEKILRKYILKVDNFSGGIMTQQHSKQILKFVTFFLYVSLAILMFLIFNQNLRQQMLFFVSLGYLTHIAGDFITVEGVPLFYPIKRKFGLKLFKVGGKFEAFLGVIMFLMFFYLIYVFGEKNDIFNFDYWTKFF